MVMFLIFAVKILILAFCVDYCCCCFGEGGGGEERRRRGCCLDLVAVVSRRSEVAAFGTEVVVMWPSSVDCT